MPCSQDTPMSTNVEGELDDAMALSRVFISIYTWPVIARSRARISLVKSQT